MNGIVIFTFIIGGFLICTCLAFMLASFFKKRKNTLTLKKSEPIRILSNDELKILNTNQCFIQSNWFYKLLNLKARIKTNQVYQLKGEYILLKSSLNGSIRRVIPTINAVIVQLPFDAHQMINQVKDEITPTKIPYNHFSDYDEAAEATSRLKEVQASIKMPLICEVVFTNHNKVVVINISTYHPDDDMRKIAVFDLQTAQDRALIHQNNLINFRNGVIGTYFDPVDKNASYKLISQRDETPLEKMVRTDDIGLISGFSYLATVTLGICIIIDYSLSPISQTVLFSLMLFFLMLTILSFFRKKFIKQTVKINTIEGNIGVRRNIDPFHQHKLLSTLIGGLEFSVNYPLNTIFFKKFNLNQTITAEITIDSNDIVGVVGWTSLNALYSKIPYSRFGTHCTRFIFGIFCTILTFYTPINTTQMLEAILNHQAVENSQTVPCYDNQLHLNPFNLSNNAIDHAYGKNQNKAFSQCDNKNRDTYKGISGTPLHQQLSAYSYGIIMILNIFFFMISGLLVLRHYKLKKVMDTQKVLYLESFSKK